MWISGADLITCSRLLWSRWLFGGRSFFGHSLFRFGFNRSLWGRHLVVWRSWNPPNGEKPISQTDDSDWLRQSHDRDLQLDLLSIGLTVDLLFATFFLQRKFERIKKNSHKCFVWHLCPTYTGSGTLGGGAGESASAMKLSSLITAFRLGAFFPLKFHSSSLSDILYFTVSVGQNYHRFIAIIYEQWQWLRTLSCPTFGSASNPLPRGRHFLLILHFVVRLRALIVRPCILFRLLGHGFELNGALLAAFYCCSCKGSQRFCYSNGAALKCIRNNGVHLFLFWVLDPLHITELATLLRLMESRGSYLQPYPFPLPAFSFSCSVVQPSQRPRLTWLPLHLQTPSASPHPRSAAIQMTSQMFVNWRKCGEVG